MTSDERRQLIEAKEEVTSRLSGIDIDSYGLRNIDPRLDDYVREVAGNPSAHCLWEQLAVARFFRMIDKYGIDATAIRRFYTFYEFLHFPGKKGLCRYSLTPVQCFQFANVYGFYSGGHRLIRECVLFVPRKFSKTTSSAAFAIWDLLYGDANAEIYTAANSQDQAKKCFDVIRGTLRKLDNVGKRFIINEQIVKPRSGVRQERQAMAQCLTSSTRTKDGLNASTVIMDEFSQARDASFLNVLTTSMGVRDNPLTVIITTASDVFDGPFHAMLQGYKRTLLGEVDDDSVFAHLFEPDIGDPEDSESTWRKVHPHLGVTVSMDFYRNEWAKAQRNGAEARLAFRTKLLNVYCDNERASWISSETARSVMQDFTPWDFNGIPDSTVAIDLSVRGDFSAVTCGIRNKDDRKFYYHTKYFFPKGALTGHVNEELYRTWAESGHLTLLDGDVIDYKAITEYVLSLGRPTIIRAIGYDSYKSQECVNMIRNTPAGGVLRAVSQSIGNFTSATESFEVALRTGRLFINDNPINAYCFGNAVLMYDHNENCKPEKRRQSDRIDGVITMLMAHKLFADVRRTVL